MNRNVERVLARLFLIFFFLAFTFGICEFLARTVFKDYLRHGWDVQHPITFVPKPYVMFVADKKNDMTVNEHGYRGPFPEMPKPSKEFRVFILGGSTVFDSQMPAKIQDLFEQSGRKHVKLYNFGLTSSVCNQDLARMVFELAELEADVFIFYGGGNDLMNLDPRPGYPHRFVFFENNPLLEIPDSFIKSMTVAAYGSQILRSLAPKFFKEKLLLSSLSSQGSQFDVSEHSEEYLRCLRKTQKVAKGLNTSLQVYFQPLAVLKTNKVGVELNSANEGFVLKYQSARVHINRAVASDKTLPRVKDLSSVFDGEGEMFVDAIHLNPKAEAKIERILFEDLKTRFAL